MADPFARSPDGDGPAGLVGVRGADRRRGAWVAPVSTSQERGHHLAAADGAGLHAVPVELPAARVRGHRRTAAATLWPLYHSVVAEPRFERDWWEAYAAVNVALARAAAATAAPGATVWVQGHPFQLVPGELRRLRPDLRIALVASAPFPGYETFVRLPWRAEVVAGITGADLVVLARDDDVRNLHQAMHRAGPDRGGRSHGAGPEPVVAFGRSADAGGRTARVIASPPVVDAPALAATAASSHVVDRARDLRRELGNPRRLVLSVDPLDPVSGIPSRLRALDTLYREGQLRAPDTVVVQVVLPATHPGAVERSLRDDVETLVARINGAHGRVGTAPVHYLHRSLGPDELAALRLAADTLLVTPVRDTAALAAHEYAACRHDERGTVVLSEFVSGAGDLPGALRVNPHDSEALQDAVLVLDGLPAREVTRRMRLMRSRVLRHDPGHRASEILRSLHEAGQAPGWSARSGRPA